jgi:TPR repeat protein
MGEIFVKSVIVHSEATGELDNAIKYYEKAKKQQFPRALNNLGNLLITQNMVSSENYA